MTLALTYPAGVSSAKTYRSEHNLHWLPESLCLSCAGRLSPAVPSQQPANGAPQQPDISGAPSRPRRHRPGPGLAALPVLPGYGWPPSPPAEASSAEHARRSLSGRWLPAGTAASGVMGVVPAAAAAAQVRKSLSRIQGVGAGFCMRISPWFPSAWPEALIHINGEHNLARPLWPAEGCVLYVQSLTAGLHAVPGSIRTCCAGIDFIVRDMATKPLLRPAGDPWVLTGPELLTITCNMQL